MSWAAAWRGGRRKLGPTEAEYKRAHPEVDWSTHEVLYTMEVISRGGPLVTTIRSHHRVLDANALYRSLDADDSAPSGTNWRRDNSWDGKVQRLDQQARWGMEDDDDGDD